MPVYEYRCKSCGETHEISHGFNDERPTKCPTCGGQLIRVFHPIGLVFKGSGFHKTDYTKSGVRAQSSDSQGDKSGKAKASRERVRRAKASREKANRAKASRRKRSLPAASPLKASRRNRSHPTPNLPRTRNRRNHRDRSD